MIKNNGCCDLEWAKKLKELGVKQESLWWWTAGRKNEFSDYTNKFYHLPQLLDKTEIEERNKGGWNIVSAFTVAELGEMLPNYVSTSNCGGGRTSERVNYLVCSNQNSREAWIAKDTKEINWVSCRDRNEANARAKMLVWLIEKGKVKV